MTSATASGLFFERVRRLGDRPALRELAVAGAPADRVLSWREWGDAVREFAAAMVAAGHQPGEAVGIFAGNGLIWPIADLGAISAGMVSVGIYPSSAPAQLRQILADCGATALVVDTRARLDIAATVLDELPRLRTVICAEPADSETARVGDWAGWLRGGAAALGDGAGAEAENRLRSLRPDATAVLVYTSGSTGEPKGAELSHRYLLASAESIRDTLGLTEADTTLSFLPYSHAGERVFGLYTRLVCGMETGLVHDHTRVWEAARAFRPTLFAGLPRFYEKVYEALQAEWAAASPAEQARQQRTLELGRARSRFRQQGSPVPFKLEQEWREAGAPLFEYVREHFGGALRLATSGGAALSREVAETLDALGVTVLGAYGMTEHLCVSFYRPDRYAFDGVGAPMPGTELRIAGDGEVLIRRGPLTFSGYLGRPSETRDAFTADGEWLRSGDLGAMDARGMLQITGRKKELIALSTGKKVAPLPIETSLAETAWIAQAMVHGEGRKFIAALLCPRRPTVEAWARERGISAPFGELLRHPEVVDHMQQAVDGVNAGLSRTEQIRRFHLLDREFSPEEGELTPTLKLRRPIIAERFRDELDSLYR